MNKSLQIDFDDEAWDKMKQTRQLLIKMFQSKFGATLTPNLVMNLAWFWKNRHQFRVYFFENNEKTEFKA